MSTRELPGPATIRCDIRALQDMVDRLREAGEHDAAMAAQAESLRLQGLLVEADLAELDRIRRRYR